MEVQVFIRSKKILSHDSLTRAICGLCTTLSTVFVDKGFGRVARFQPRGKQRPTCEIFLSARGASSANSLPCRIRSRKLKCPPSYSESAVVCHHPSCRLADLFPTRRVDHRSRAHHRKVHDPPQREDRSGRLAGEGARRIPETRRE